MGAREKAEGLYVEKPVCDNYRRQHFPGHPAEKADVLRLLAELEEQGQNSAGNRQLAEGSKHKHVSKECNIEIKTSESVIPESASGGCPESIKKQYLTGRFQIFLQPSGHQAVSTTS